MREKRRPKLDRPPHAKRTAGIAGGSHKYHAILGAQRGMWVEILFTNGVKTARRWAQSPLTHSTESV